MTGVGAMLARDVPFSAIYWGLLEPIRHALLPRCAAGSQPTQTQIMAVNFAAGTMGGAAAAAITTPMVSCFDCMSVLEDAIGIGSCWWAGARVPGTACLQ